MGDAVRMVAEIRREVAAELRERVRRRLREQSVDWLVEELLTALLPEHDPAPLIPCQVPRPSGPGSERAARTARLHGLGLTEKTLLRPSSAGTGPTTVASSKRKATCWTRPNRAATSSSPATAPRAARTCSARPRTSSTDSCSAAKTRACASTAPNANC